jgi:DNA-binding transcriptional MerR regulator
VRSTPARTLAAAGTAGIGVAAGAAAYVIVGGLPGVLYAAGICLAALVGTVAIAAGGTETEPVVMPTATPTATPVAMPVAMPDAAPQRQRRVGKSRIIGQLRAELAATGAELEEHRHALANLATQLSSESETAQRHAEQLEQRIRELEAERDGLLDVVDSERERFEQTLNELGGGIGRHGNELAELERELEALIAR